MIRSILFVLGLMMTFSGVIAQDVSGSFGSTYVPANGFISIFGPHTFDYRDCGLYPGMLLTDRTNPGYVNFGEASSWTGANDESHVDGYVRTFSEGAFAFPVGDDGRLRMIATSGSTNSAASYSFSDAAGATGNMNINNDELDGVSTLEYWTLAGDDEASVTLTWDQFSTIEDLVDGDINKLTIVGWDGDSWEIIPSSINDFTLLNSSQNVLNVDVATSFVVGSLSSTDPVVLNDYDYITFGSLSTPRSSFKDGESLSFRVYPTPAKVGDLSKVSYELKGQTGKLDIYDGFNRLVFSSILETQRGEVLLDNVNQNVERYLITITNEDGSRLSKFHFVIR